MFNRTLTRLDSSADRTSPASPDYWQHEGLVYSQQSYCLLRLGKTAEAATSANRGLRLYNTSFVGALAFTTLRLATARLRSGEIEEAARLIGDGGLLATRNRSARLTKEVRTTRARLQPWQDIPAVKALDEQLAGMGFARKY